MGLFRIKTLVFLTAILLCSGAAFVCSAAQSSADDNVESLMNQSFPLQNNQPKLTVGSDTNNIGAGGLFYKMMLMVLMVIFLGVAVMYLSKKLLPKLNLPGKRIQVTETVHLGPRKSIHLVKVGRKTLLIGSTNENISSLADVTDQIFDADLSADQTEEE